MRVGFWVNATLVSEPSSSRLYTRRMGDVLVTITHHRTCPSKPLLTREFVELGNIALNNLD